MRDLQLMVANTPAGKTVEMEILRDGKRLSLPVTMAEWRREESAAAAPASAARRKGWG